MLPVVQLVAKVYPPRASIAEVIDIASRFWADHPEEYISIHCAYGELPGPHTAELKAGLEHAPPHGCAAHDILCRPSRHARISCPW